VPAGLAGVLAVPAGFAGVLVEGVTDASVDGVGVVLTPGLGLAGQGVALGVAIGVLGVG